MGKYAIEQIGQIILNNPNRNLIKEGKDQADKLMLHLHGVGLESALTRCDYFENLDLYPERKKYTISNKDLFGRLLQQEDMIWTSNGGSSYFSLDQAEEDQMNALLSSVQYEMPLRKWMRNFAIQAYRADPMGIIFMEVEQLLEVDGQPMNTPRTYPTYKSIYSIYDYEPNGRKLEYVCFQLSVGECLSFGIQDDQELKDVPLSNPSPYFRFCDDAQDIIVKKVKDNGKDQVIIATNLPKNPIENVWGRTAAFIISDLVQFNNPQLFVSPLDLVVELADSFLNDRSIRDLQKKYHGFAKAVEPALECGTCAGNGFLEGQACPDCTPKGAEQGTGFRLRTKISDVSKFPLSVLKEVNSFDFKKIFGYVTPDIEGWKMQDMSLASLEEIMRMTYWGTANMQKQQTSKNQKGEPSTATEITVNQAPVYAHLNMIADWAENTESKIADFIGEFWFRETFEKSQIAYGRNYVLETPDELLEKYQVMRTKGAPEAALDDVLIKYYSALYQNNPAQLAICTKLMMLEPFVHQTPAQCLAIVDNELDFIKKIYFGDWKRKSVTTDQLLSMKIDALDKMLETYALGKYTEAQQYQALAQMQNAQATAAGQAFQSVRTGDRIQNTSN